MATRTFLHYGESEVAGGFHVSRVGQKAAAIVAYDSFQAVRREDQLHVDSGRIRVTG